MSVLGDRARRYTVGATMCMVVLTLLLPFALPEITPAAHRPLPTFTKDVAPILFKNCVKCHQTGELASAVPLVTYETVRPRAGLIKQEVVTREMPPWPADPARSLKFRNDPRLSQKDIDTIIAWVKAGAPKGDDAELPPIPPFADGWTHPQGLKPDLVISLPGEVQVPAEGAIPYVRVLVQVPFSENKWISAIQTRPTNPAVVHHMALTEVALPNGMSPSVVDQVSQEMGVPTSLFISPAVKTPLKPSQPDMLAIYTPGTTLEMYSNGSAKLLKGGENMYVIFNVHYETTGKPETDRSSIALWFATGPQRHQLFRVNGAGQTIIADGTELLTDAPGTKAEGTNVVIPPIPPFAENYELIGVTAYPQPVTIYQFQPHAHYRGKDFTYAVVYPDGREQTVLSVPKYDHRWQMAYELATPLKLPAGSKLVVTAHYDNSKMNIALCGPRPGHVHNPAPEKAVYFRDMNQSWDEMFTPFVQYSVDGLEPGQIGIATQKERADISEPQHPAENRVFEVSEAVGCLERNPAGKWLLTHASQAMPSETQSTSSTELRAVEARPLGNQRFQLLGVSVFNPSKYQSEEVAVKGILIDASKDIRINVTSLQGIANKGCLRRPQ